MILLCRYDIVTATFNPKRLDDLRPDALNYIGNRGQWLVAWKIGPKDTNRFMGQWAFTPHPINRLAVGWVPQGAPGEMWVEKNICNHQIFCKFCWRCQNCGAGAPANAEIGWHGKLMQKESKCLIGST